MENKVSKIANIEMANDKPFTFIGGPCQIESEEHAVMVADFLVNLTSKLGIPYIFKASFDKANRTSINGKRGIGLEKSIKVFERIHKEFGCAITTDIHTAEQCAVMGEVVDVLQVPAFLCRQTDLLEAAAKHGKAVNVKKGQFLDPYGMKNVVEKLEHFGAKNIGLIERGSSFGYNNLVVDMRGLEIMAQTGYPVIIDATHSVQMPGSNGTSTGGDRRMAPIIARSAIASRQIAGVFCEVHNDPDHAFSDGPNSLTFEMTETLLKQLKEIDSLMKGL